MCLKTAPLVIIETTLYPMLSQLAPAAVFYVVQILKLTVKQTAQLIHP